MIRLATLAALLGGILDALLGPAQRRPEPLAVPVRAGDWRAPRRPDRRN